MKSFTRYLFFDILIWIISHYFLIVFPNAFQLSSWSFSFPLHTQHVTTHEASNSIISLSVFFVIALMSKLELINMKVCSCHDLDSRQLRT